MSVLTDIEALLRGMKKETWAWVAGVAIFAGIVGVWVWQLPNTLNRAGSGRDQGLAAIISSFRGSKSSLGEDLQKAQAELETNMKNFSQLMQTPTVQAGAIDDLKQKIESRGNINVPPAESLAPSNEER